MSSVIKSLTKICYLMLFTALSLFSSAKVTAQIVGFQFATPRAAGNEPQLKPSLVLPGLKVSALERGAGLSTSADGGLVRSFVALSKIQSGTAVADTAIAVANDLYFMFEVKVDKGFNASFNNLNFKVRASGGGAKVYYWKYSTDNKLFNKLAEPVKITLIGAEGQAMPQINLADHKQLQHIKEGTSVFFRLYTNGSNNTTGTTAIGRSASGTSNDYVLLLNGKVERN